MRPGDSKAREARLRKQRQANKIKPRDKTQGQLPLVLSGGMKLIKIGEDSPLLTHNIEVFSK